MCALVGSAQRSIQSAQCKALMRALEIAYKRTSSALGGPLEAHREVTLWPTTGPLGVAL